MTPNGHNSEHDDDEELINEDRDSQLKMMREWFFNHFEDPAERTPYESREGGYIWIWGGPYDAREELESKFSDVVSDDVIEELADELSSDCWEWAPTPSREDYDDFLVEDIALITEYHSNFSNAILDIECLLKTKIEDSVANCFYRLLFVNAITALETYLSDAFINTVVPNPVLMRRFIESTPEFQGEKIALSDVFKAIEGIEQKAKSYLADVVWHNLHRVKPMYKDMLDIDFPKDIGAIFRAIIKRHDIVHRNGKTKSGNEILIQLQDVIDIIAAVQSFTQHIDAQLSEFKSNIAVNEDAINAAKF
ncbi:MAG: hypothetical protein ACXW1W_16105 [Methylococcaceae bacterium]